MDTVEDKQDDNASPIDKMPKVNFYRFIHD